MNLETIQMNAVILETKLELTNILLSIEGGELEGIEKRVIRVIENLQEVKYDY